MIYDLIIIGGGPAGAAASVYAARKRLKTLLITYDFGGQSVVSEKIENWIGTPAISGLDLAESFKKHVLAAASDILEVKEGENVSSVSKIDGGFEIATENGAKFTSKTILVVTGSSRRKLSAKNADVLEHKGLTYCASCDGPIFSGQDVAVVGGGNAAFETAAQLLAYCRSVTLLNHSEGFGKADPVTVNKVLTHQNMKALDMVEVTEVLGEKMVSGLIYHDKRNDSKKELKVTGIFVEIGQVPNSKLVEGLVELDGYKRIKIDPWTGASSVPGIWAAGDISDIRYHQNNIAAGDAVKAVEDIYLHIKAK